MAAVANAKTIGNMFSNDEQIVHVVYDFSVDGGTAGNFTLLTATADLVITSAYANVVAACTGSGATLSCGYDTDVDAIIDETGVASLGIGVCVQPIVVAGTPDALPLPLKFANTKLVTMTIGTANFTAGKVDFVFHIQKF